MPSEFEKCRRRHPSYCGWEEQQLREIEENFEQTAVEPEYAVRQHKRGGRRKPRFNWRRTM